MDLVNDTCFEAGWMVSRIEPPAHALTVVVKGTFVLRPGSPAVPAERQVPLTGDVLDEGHPAQPLRYPLDLVPLKPRTDLLVVGHAHAPGGKPVGGLQASFQIGPIAKSIAVIGDRQWDARGRMAEPTPFVRMPIGWERAFGGPGFEHNPCGLGFKPAPRADGSVSDPLPNLELPDDLIAHRGDRPAPAGFGPIPDTWPQRLRKFGRPDARYWKERWPGLPASLSWDFFNSAPEDQQIEGFLRGDESFRFENLHPVLARLEGRLPGVRVQAFVNERVRAHDEFREVPLRLDTVWAQPDVDQLILVWRGHVAVRSPKLLEIRHLYLISTSLAAPELPAPEVPPRLQSALEAREREDDELEEEPEPPEDTDGADESGSDTATENDAENENDATDESEPARGDNPQLAAASAPAPGPTAVDAADPSEDADAGDDSDGPESAEPEETGEDLDAALTRAQVERRLATGQGLAGCDLSGLNLAGLDFGNADLRETILEGAVLANARLAGANLSGALLGRAILRNLDAPGAEFAGADLTEARLGGANLAGARFEGADLTKARLRGADLSDAHLADAILEEADLSDAVLVRANLASADLGKAILHRTNLAGANLTEAALEHAWGFEIQARGAVFRKARAAHATFCSGDFREIQATGSVWQFARLPLADFTGACLDDAELSSAQLPEAILDAASLKNATLNEAVLRLARLHRANLFAASLDLADLTGASLTESNLYGASLMDCATTNARLTGANLRRIKAKEPIV